MADRDTDVAAVTTPDAQTLLDLLRWLREENDVAEALAHFAGPRRGGGAKWTNADDWAVTVLVEALRKIRGEAEGV